MDEGRGAPLPSEPGAAASASAEDVKVALQDAEEEAQAEEWDGGSKSGAAAGGLLRTTTRSQNELTPRYLPSGWMLILTYFTGTRFVVEY